MKCIILLVLWCSNGLYADSSAKFYITVKENPINASCQLDGNQEVDVWCGEIIRFDAESMYHIERSSCRLTRPDGITKDLEVTNYGDTGFFVAQKSTMDMTGEWSFKLKLNDRNGNQNNDIPPTYCNAKVNVREYKTISFNISRNGNIAYCSNDSLKSIGTLEEGGWIKIEANGADVLKSDGSCTFKNKENPNQSPIPPIKFNYTDSRSSILTSAVFQLQKTMNRTILKCSFGIIKDSEFLTTQCYLSNVEIVTPLALSGNEDEKSDITLPLAIAGGILVFIIIIGQTIALLRCHFKSKAQSRNGLEHLNSGSKSLDRDDRARYSTAPSLRSNKPTNRAAADTDSHIYEFVGVNALYHGHEASAGFTEANIKNRPPLPLPGSPELEKLATNSPPRPPKAKTSVMATMSPNSNTSTLKKTEPKPQLAKTARPPKPDEESLPGSLKRPPKPLPKTGSIPKPSATDAKFLELKNALIKRNAGMVPSTSSPSATLEKSVPDQGSPAHLGTLELKEAIKKRNGGIVPSSSSPSGTLEKRPPPPTPKKTFLNTQPRPGAIMLPSTPVQHSAEPVNPKPLAAVNPTVKPLALSLKSKIEATLKVPGTVPGMPVKSQPVPVSSVSPPPVTPVMPSPMMKNRPLPVPNIATRPLPPIQTEEVPPAAPSVIRNRPLPVPNLASRPLPPIQQEAATPNSDDEWDYEPLEKYNIYNV